MNRTIKTVVFWVVIGASAMLLWQLVRSAPEDRRSTEISYSRFMSDVEAGKVANVTIRGTQIQGVYRDGKGTFRLIGPSNPGVYLDALRSRGVEIQFRDTAADSTPLQLLGTWAPLIMLGALWVFMVRQNQRKNSIPPGGGISDPPIRPR